MWNLLYSIITRKPPKSKKKKLQKVKVVQHYVPLFFTNTIDFKQPNLSKDMISMEPIDDPFLLRHMCEITKPITLPEQRVFNDVDEMINSI